ncbi:MAG TPA: stage II sporulation protein P [Firmicutes bacterium]|nr:stage II sporulation protein P [Bacillota bacterium]
MTCIRHECHRSWRSCLSRTAPLIIAVVTLVFGFLLQGAAFAEHELSDGYYTLVDEADNEIFHTAIVLLPGDVFIDEDNSTYEVVTIDGQTARARLSKAATLDNREEATGGSTVSQLSGIVESISRSISQLFLAGQQQTGKTVVLYNTHSDESYAPSSGTSTKDWGDVYKVAAAFEQALKKHGLDVVRSTDNHNPHDGGAYTRSRRTLARLLKERPVAAFDIHRDAVPPEVYRATVQGEDVTRITLVIGQQNQTRGQNLTFAKKLKSAADSKAPGLIKGILWAQGNYNQDMLPRASLMEVGAHTNNLEEAERAVGIFASAVVPIILSAESASGLQQGSPGRSLAWIVGIIIVGSVCYVLINSRRRQRQ